VKLALAIMAVAMALIGAPATADAVTVGPADLAKTTTQSCSLQACVFANNTGPAGVSLSAPFAGVVTRVRLVGTGQLTVRVMHFSSSGTSYRFLATGPTLVGSGGSATDTFAIRLPLNLFDTLGLENTTSSTIGSNSSSAWTTDTWSPPPSNGPNSVAADLGPSPGFWDYNWDIEPDADADGFGDESQDRCPGSAGTDRGCKPGVLDPQVVQVVQVTQAGAGASVDPAGVSLSKSRCVLSVPVSCPASHSGPCAGTVAAQTSGKVAIASRKRGRRAVLRLGSARFRVSPGKAQGVKIKLSRKARRTVRKLKKVKLRIVLSETRTVTKQL
jgi:hypothetical protein